jgi:serine/threonine-protein kinase
VKLCPDDGTVLEHQPATSSQLGKVLDGKYRLDAFLSQGGMGGVYRATHVMLNKDVAVKLINPELVTSPEIVRRFQREARAATALSHPNIVAVYDLGQTAEGTLYIAMEYVDGPSLRSLIERGGPLPVARTLTIARQLTSALSLAHRRGIIHRDLKPHNVMLARTEDGQQIAKLVDFGIAKTFEEGTQLTVAGFTPGTPQYMSPEQAEGRVVDARSDLYSLGIVIYEMLTGQVPFNAPSLSSLLIQHIRDIPEPPSLKNPNVSIPPDLEAITLRCLAKNPDDRFQTADELGTALDRVAAAMDTAVASMQATVPMAGQQAPGQAAWNAATIPAAASAATVPAPPTPAPAPTVKVQPALVSPPSADTRPTVAPPQAAAAAAPPPPKKIGVPAVFGAVFVVAAIVIVYTNYFSGRAPTAPAATPSAENRPSPDVPAASPAMAPQPSASPSTPAAPGTASPAAASAVGGQTAAAAGQPASSAANRPPSAPAPGAAAPAARPAASASANGSSAGATAVGAGAAAAPAAVSTTARASGGAAPSGAGAAPQAAFPENPTVFFECAGAPALCGQLRPAVADALEKAGLSSVRNAARADIDVLAMVDIADERVNDQFKTTFVVRNYSIEITAEAPRTGENVPMPPPTSVSFDQQLGAERAVEKARVVASDIVDRVKAFAKKKHGG